MDRRSVNDVEMVIIIKELYLSVEGKRQSRVGLKMKMKETMKIFINQLEEQILNRKIEERESYYYIKKGKKGVRFDKYNTIINSNIMESCTMNVSYQAYIQFRNLEPDKK